MAPNPEQRHATVKDGDATDPSAFSLGQEGLAGCDAISSKCCQGQPANQEQRPAIEKRPSGLEYCEAAGASISVDGSYGTSIRVTSQPYLFVTRPIAVDFGALGMSLTEDQAIAFGDALIQVAHRRRAAIASAKADAQLEGDAA